MEYIGSELELFASARNWKIYYRSLILPYLQGDVLEVGSGIGSNTDLLINPNVRSWTCLEPDSKLIEESKRRVNDVRCRFCNGTIEEINDKNFDSIIYIDVLEHIENDVEEIDRALKLLRQNGYLIVLSPAHQYLFSPFDSAVGHHRRYNKKMLERVVDPILTKRKIFYLDSIGFFLSLVNKTLLRQSDPTHRQIRFWDNIVIPMSRFIDWILNYRFGKTIIGIWEK